MIIQLPVIIGVIAICGLMFNSSPLLADNGGGQRPAGDGHLRLYSYHIDEYLDIKFRDENGLDPSAMAKIEKLMRSQDGAVHGIDPALVDLLDNLQDHFGADTIEIISGYRSRKYNRDLRVSGRGAAGESLHMKGLAADIHIDEVDEKSVYDYVAGLSVGGAGYYPRYDFVHVDTGPRRTWSEEDAKERVLVGAGNSPNPGWAAVTDRNDYHAGETLSVNIVNNGYERQLLSAGRVWAEMFKRGQWSEHFKIDVTGKSKRLGAGENATFEWHIPKKPEYGRYRLVIFPSKKSIPMYSNEFYVKKRLDE